MDIGQLGERDSEVENQTFRAQEVEPDNSGPGSGARRSVLRRMSSVVGRQYGIGNGTSSSEDDD